MGMWVAIQPRIEGPLEAPPRTEARTEATPEKPLAMPDGGRYKLIDGELRERNAGAFSNLIAFRVGKILGNHCDPLDLGWLFAADLGYQCFPWKPRQVRRTDVSFIRRERYPLDEIARVGFTKIAPDLAIEVVSPNDLASKDVEEKVVDDVRAGVYPATRTAYVVRGDGTGYRLRSEDELTGEDVVPGFRCRVADLIPGPPAAESAVPAPPGVHPEAPR
jgi:Uma2 family endonuclease